MSVCGYSSLIATLLVTSITLAPATKAGLLIDETDGNFSSNWVAPTQVQTGATGISGAGAPEWMGGDRLDIFHFSGLTPGASSMVFEFSLTGPINPNAYSNGGGSIYYSYVPFSGTYYVDLGGGNVQGSHNLLAGNFDVTYNPWEAANGRNRGNSTFTLNLSEQFQGELFLALDFTYGQVSYNVNVPTWVVASDSLASSDFRASAVPLPATVLLMLIGLLGMAAICHQGNCRSSVLQSA